ncbi:unnamed protein product, partial [Dibothriocephalus latus]
MHDDDDYFNDDEGGEELEYQPAPGSPAGQATDEAGNEATESDDSDDPLDKFMESIELGSINRVSMRGVRDDIEQEDEMETYLRFMEENPNVGVTGEEDEIYEYDAE